MAHPELTMASIICSPPLIVHSSLCVEQFVAAEDVVERPRTLARDVGLGVRFLAGQGSGSQVAGRLVVGFAVGGRLLADRGG